MQTNSAAMKKESPFRSPKRRIQSKKKEGKNLKQLREFSLLLVCVLILFFSILWFHLKFQEPHFQQKSPLIFEFVYILFFSFIYIASFLGSIHSLLVLSPKILKASQNSKSLNLISNISFCFYMTQYSVIYLKMVLRRTGVSTNVYDIWDFSITDTISIFWIALVICLCFELPASSLWRTYVDRSFLTKV